jgi:hypothetical protein
MNEWVAFGIVAVICGILAALVRLSGEDESSSADTPTDNAPP